MLLVSIVSRALNITFWYNDCQYLCIRLLDFNEIELNLCTIIGINHYGDLTKFLSGFLLPTFYGSYLIYSGFSLFPTTGYDLGITLSTIGFVTVCASSYSLFCEVFSRVYGINPKIPYNAANVAPNANDMMHNWSELSITPDLNPNNKGHQIDKNKIEMRDIDDVI